MKGRRDGGRMLACFRQGVHVDCDIPPAWTARAARFGGSETGGAVPAARHGGPLAGERQLRHGMSH